MRWSPTAKTVAILTSGLLAAGALSAPAALATYPPNPGTPVWDVNRTKVPAGKDFTAGVTNATNGCLVRYQVRDSAGTVLEKRKRSVKSNKNRQRFTAPSQTGSYFLSITVYGANCPAASRGTTIITILVD